MAFPCCQHVERIAKGELAHDVKGEVMEPRRYIHGRAQTLGYRRCQEGCVMVYLWFVLAKSFGSETLIPDSAALIVGCSVAGGYDGGSGKQEVVKGCFGAFAARAIDFGHCGRASN